MIRTTPACAIWCTEQWICSWSCWLSTSSSTVITISLVHAHLVWRCSVSVSALFWNFIFYEVV